MALAHHDAAFDHQRCRGKTELIGAEQRADQDVAAGLHWPSACTRMRLRSLLSTSVCCVSARPSSHGVPACLIDDTGEAPVPPSCPAITTWSALVLVTPAAATVPTPISLTSLTLMLALRLAFLRSWMSCARSSIE